MRKLAVIAAAAMALAGTWTAVAGQNNDISNQPSANAYVSMDFGHSNPARATAAPLHYGLRMSYDQRLRAHDGGALPALAQWDFDNRGNRIAMVGGIPFMAHIRPPMRQAEGQPEGQTNGQPASGVGPEGLDFFDLTLLVAGVAAIGYIVYEVAQNDDAEAVTTTGGTTGGLLGTILDPILGGGTTGGTGGTTTGGILDPILDPILGGGTTGSTTGGTTTGGLLDPILDPILPGYTSRQGVAAVRDVERQRWLDGGSGQMGDLQPR